MTVPDQLERLDAPPIIEVVCGVLFNKIDEIDPVFLGSYWRERKDDYPRKEILPALVDPVPQLQGSQVTITIGDQPRMPPLRSWLLSPSEDFILQIQFDRFYMNWRKRTGAYPSFSGKAGGESLKQRVLTEYERFAAFVQAQLGRRPEPIAVELSKVDQLDRDRHWKPGADLSAMLPWLDSFVRFSSSGAPPLALRVHEPQEGTGNGLFISIDLGRNGDAGEVVRLDTRARLPLTGGETELPSAFTKANDDLNRVFDRLIPKEQRDKRFSEKGDSNVH